MLFPIKTFTKNVVKVDDKIFLVKNGTIYDAFSRRGEKLGILKELNSFNSKLHFYIPPDYIIGKVWGFVDKNILVEIGFI